MTEICKNDLIKKYGNTKVLVIDNITLFKEIPKDNFINCFYLSNEYLLFKELFGQQYKLRYEAELDNNYKQPIPYVIFKKQNKNEFFCMERIDGDSRLIGKKSLGVGGHVDYPENIETALYREIAEEVGLSKNDIIALDFKGLILDESNSVGSVHIGLLFIATVDDSIDMYCLENDKLKGYFINYQQLTEFYYSKVLETWSEIALKNIIGSKF